MRPVAAPDHKISRCIQKSALFSGGADEGIEEARSIGAPRRRCMGRGAIRDLGLSPIKIFKNQLLNRVFSAYLQTEMVSPAVLASFD